MRRLDLDVRPPGWWPCCEAQATTPAPGVPTSRKRVHDVRHGLLGLQHHLGVVLDPLRVVLNVRVRGLQVIRRPHAAGTVRLKSRRNSADRAGVPAGRVRAPRVPRDSLTEGGRTRGGHIGATTGSKATGQRRLDPRYLLAACNCSWSAFSALAISDKEEVPGSSPGSPINPGHWSCSTSTSPSRRRGRLDGDAVTKPGLAAIPGGIAAVP